MTVWAGVGTLGLLGAALSTVATVSDAVAAPLTFSCVAGPDGTNQSMTVPAGMNQMTITATGAQGGADRKSVV